MIAFESGGDVYVVQSDGSCHMNITESISDVFGENPFDVDHDLNRSLVDFVWTPDSQSLAVSGFERLFVARIDEAEVHTLSGFFLSTPFGSPLGPSYYPAPNPWTKDNREILMSKWIDVVTSNITIIDVRSGETQELLHETGVWNDYPSWSPDKSKVVFVQKRDRKSQIMIMTSDGSGLRSVTPALEFDLSSPIWVRQSPE